MGNLYPTPYHSKKNMANVQPVLAKLLQAKADRQTRAAREGTAAFLNPTLAQPSLLPTQDNISTLVSHPAESSPYGTAYPGSSTNYQTFAQPSPAFSVST